MSCAPSCAASFFVIMVLNDLGQGNTLFFFHLTYSRWTSSLPSCLRSQRIFPSLPGSRLTTLTFYRDASSALLQLVNQWLNFTYSRSHAFRYERKNTNPTLVRIELTTSVLADVQLTYSTTRATSRLQHTWGDCSKLETFSNRVDWANPRTP